MTKKQKDDYKKIIAEMVEALKEKLESAKANPQ